MYTTTKLTTNTCAMHTRYEFLLTRFSILSDNFINNSLHFSKFLVHYILSIFTS